MGECACLVLLLTNLSMRGYFATMRVASHFYATGRFLLYFVFIAVMTENPILH